MKMRVPENNSLKEEIEEILKLCKEAEEEEGDGSSYFNEPVSEQEMTEWEETNGVKIPESYKEWLRFTGKCHIVNNTANFYGPKEFNMEYVPDDLVVIGDIIGDGERLCFSKSTGEFVRFFEWRDNGRFEDFGGVLKKIIRLLNNEPAVSRERIQEIMAMVRAKRNDK